MSATTLQSWLASHIVNGSLTLNSQLSAPAGALANAFGVANLVITDAKPGAGDQLIVGSAALLNQSLSVALCGDDGATPWLSLIAAWPTGATFSALFGPSPWWWARTSAGAMAPQPSFFDGLVLNGTQIVATSLAGQPSVDAAAGLNVLGQFTPGTTFADGLLVDALAFASEGGALRGTVAVGVPPMADLRVALSTTLFSLPSLKVGAPFLWLSTLLDPDTQLPNSSIAVGLPIELGAAQPIDGTISCLLSAGDSVLTLALNLDSDATLANGLADIASLLGAPAGSQLTLPSSLSALDAQLEDIVVGVRLPTVDPPTSFAIWAVQVDAALAPGTTWSVPLADGEAAITDLSTSWIYAQGATPSLCGIVSGTLALGRSQDVLLTIVANAPDFALSGTLQTTAPLRDLVPTALEPALAWLGEMTLEMVSVSVDPTARAYQATLAIGDLWSKKLGNLGTFSIENLIASIGYAASSWSFTVTGNTTLGGVDLYTSWTYTTGAFTMTAAATNLPLGALVTDLVGTSVSALLTNLVLTDVAFTITEASEQWTASLVADAAGYGKAFFELIAGTGETWGFGAGIQLDVVDLKDVPGCDSLKTIGVAVSDVVLVASSVALAQSQVIGAVTLPAQLGSVGPGVAFAGNVQLSAQPKGSKLAKAYGWINPTAVAALQFGCTISDSGSTLGATFLIGCALDATWNSKAPTAGTIVGSPNKLDLAVYFGVSVGETTEFFLRGTMTLPITKTPPQFSAEVDLQDDGLLLLGTMLGAWVTPIGLTLSDAMVVVGFDWEYVPSVGFAGELSFGSFDASLAVLFNSDEPLNSVLAGSINGLSLGDLASILIPPTVTIPAKIQTALTAIRVGGLPGTTVALDPALVKALNENDLETVASGLPALALSNNVTQTLLVTGVVGQRWYITDRRCAATGMPTHYQVKADGQQIVVTLNPQLYVSLSTTVIGAGPGAIKYSEGFALYGSLDLFGLKATLAVDITVDPTGVPNGLALAVHLPSISLFKDALTLSRSPNDKSTDPGNGPYLTLATQATTDAKGQPVPAHFQLSCALEILGYNAVDALVTFESTGLHAVLTSAIAGADLTLDWTASPALLTGSARATLTVGPTFDLGKLGKVTPASFSIDVSFSLNFDDSAQTISATSNVSFSVAGMSGSFGGTVATSFNVMPAIDDAVSAFTNAIASNPDLISQILQQMSGTGGGGGGGGGSCFAPHLVAAQIEARRLAATANGDIPDPLDGRLPAAQLSALHKLRAALLGSAYGTWLVSIYDKITGPLVALYQQNPSTTQGGTTYTLQQVFVTYDAQTALTTLVGAINNEGAAVSLPPGLLQQLQNLLSGVLSFVPSTNIIAEGLNALVGQIGVLAGFVHNQLSYDQMIAALNQQSVPANPFSGAS